MELLPIYLSIYPSIHPFFWIFLINKEHIYALLRPGSLGCTVLNITCKDGKSTRKLYTSNCTPIHALFLITVDANIQTHIDILVTVAAMQNANLLIRSGYGFSVILKGHFDTRGSVDRIRNQPKTGNYMILTSTDWTLFN